MTPGIALHTTPHPRRRLFQIWHFLTTPTIPLDADTARRVRLLLALLFVGALVGAFGGILGLLDDYHELIYDGIPPNLGNTVISTGPVLVAIFLYVLARTGRHRLAATLLTASISGIIGLSGYLSFGKQGPYFLYFLPLSVIMASLLLSQRATVYAALTNIGLIFLLANIVPNWGTGYYDELAMNLVSSALLVVAAAIRQRDAAQIQAQIQELERTHRAEREAREKAERADQVKTAFLASMSHELRTPLNTVINFTRFVADGDLGPVNAEQADTLNSVARSGRHLLSLINDVLDMSKIQAGSFKLFVEKQIDLKVILESTLKTGKALLDEKPVTLAASIDPDLPLIDGDRQRLLQVFLNIMSNACKFTDEGSIHLIAAMAGDKVRVSIQDSGPGIGPEDHALIFEAFKQTETGLRKGGGTGLGMPISKTLVEAHGGRLMLDSRSGGGATFTVDLPLHAPSPPVGGGA